MHVARPPRLGQPQALEGVQVRLRRLENYYGRFPKFHRAFLGQDPGTLKSDIVSKEHPQLICPPPPPGQAMLQCVNYVYIYIYIYIYMYIYIYIYTYVYIYIERER